ncbi:hypothetical protein Leryth_021222 [Lithospermum erythrorhizon]|nr:hypothetical protein Leryth_021222 [Lithospermum erythrorhizon]
MSRIQEYGSLDKGKKPVVEEVELSLSLSLNGKFGVDKNAKVGKKSTVLMSPVVNDPPLVRTCSVQVRNGEGGRKEEIQMIKKMAKRKRMERMGIVRAVREKVDGDSYGGSKLVHGNEEKNNVVQESDGGSSPGCGSSDVSDPAGHQTIQVPKNSIEGTSESLSPPDQNENMVAVIPKMESPNVASDSLGNESKKALIEEMANRGLPYVFTTLNGPNHVKVEGFLQKYGRGQPVKIVCVCHGVHHSPAEFLKHAGGEAIANPLKHIVVTVPSVS